MGCHFARFRLSRGRRSSSCHYVIFLVSQVHSVLSLSLSIKHKFIKKTRLFAIEREKYFESKLLYDCLSKILFSLLYKNWQHCVIEFSRWFFAYEYLSIASFWLRHTGALTLYGLKRLLLKLQNQHFIIRIFWFIPRMSAFTTNVSWATVFHVLKIDGRPFLLW